MSKGIHNFEQERKNELDMKRLGVYQMNLNIETITHDDYYEVKVGGELDVYTVPELKKF